MSSILVLLFSLAFLCGRTYPLSLSLSQLSPPSKAPPANTPAIPTSGIDSPSRTWSWRGCSVRYVKKLSSSSTSLGSVVLIHGFGGNCDHWRRNLQPLADSGLDVYAIDLLGYGFSEKRNPAELREARGPDGKMVNGEVGRDFSDLPERYNGGKDVVGPFGAVGSTPFVSMTHPIKSAYNFYTWAEQTSDFISEVVKDPRGCHLVCNSIGSCVGLQVAIDRPDFAKSVAILDPSLRMLNVKRQSPFFTPFVSLFQKFLRESAAGKAFFGNVATAKTVRSVLEQAYCDSSQVSEELVECILRPGKTAGATEVFLDFISYSGGPLPEEQLKIISTEGSSVPVAIGWGAADPWEPVTREFGEFECVKRFQVFEGVGHCPQDENPAVVNDFVVKFIDDVL